jgi:hypothetical protein
MHPDMSTITEAEYRHRANKIIRYMYAERNEKLDQSAREY